MDNLKLIAPQDSQGVPRSKRSDPLPSRRGRHGASTPLRDVSWPLRGPRWRKPVTRSQSEPVYAY